LGAFRNAVGVRIKSTGPGTNLRPLTSIVTKPSIFRARGFPRRSADQREYARAGCRPGRPRAHKGCRRSPSAPGKGAVCCQTGPESPYRTKQNRGVARHSLHLLMNDRPSGRRLDREELEADPPGGTPARTLPSHYQPCNPPFGAEPEIFFFFDPLDKGPPGLGCDHNLHWVWHRPDAQFRGG